ncbi:MAG: branched-chain amino acid transport system permease protein LivM [Burkholderiaceae bacterium]|jgi:branched-chain amino acid transport system permease protein|nr:MAG: branched-chain amino acid transport system permease protein LivM [Burkholderiaceae bacterium]
MMTESRHSARWHDFGVPIVLACGALAILVASFLVAPQWLFVLQDIVAFGLFAVATNLLVGYGGMVSFGQAVFYGLGAYVMALGWQRYHAPFWLLFVLAPLIGAVAALIIGALALRTREWYFALLTLAFSQLFFTIANRWYDFTGGDNGVFGPMIPSTLAQPRHGLWFVLAVSFIALLLLWAITVSPFGLTLRAIRENPQRVEAIGVNLRRHQLYAFTLSGAFCALAGTLFVVHDQSAFPGLFQWTQSGEPILMAMIGGMNYFLGPFVGAIIFIVAHNYLVAHAASAWELILGIVLVLIVLFAPDGLLGLWGSRASGSHPFMLLRTVVAAMRSARRSR